LQQFSESYPIQFARTLDSTAVPGAYVNITPSRPLVYRLDAMLASNSDSIDHTLLLALSDEGSGITPVGDVLIPAGSGHGALPAVDVLARLAPAYAQYLTGAPSAVVAYGVKEGITAGTIVVLWASGGYM
jgi:hypothetical protein